MPPAASGSSEAARRLFQAGRPLPGTPAEAYLRARGITGRLDWPALRYHPSVYYRETDNAPLESWPALLAAVTDLGGNITGIQRTWLDPHRAAKAPLADPRRALGHLLGNGVRFGKAADIVAAGEGVETMLACKSVLPALPVVAGLSANHLAALELAPALRRLYVARDNDAAGIKAANRLRERSLAAGIEIRDLVPVYGDFNLDLCRLGANRMRAHLADQLVPSDRTRFLPDTSPLRSAAVSSSVISVHRRRAGRKKGFSSAAAVCLSRKRAAQASFPSGDLPAAQPGCNGAGQLFSAAGLIIQGIRTMGSPRSARLCSAKQNSCPAPSSAALRPCGCNPSPPPAKGSP